MAITARFEADFNSFFTAVDTAEVKLRSFETGANKVETALSRMVDSLSGRKIIQDASLMVEAVERIGGVAKLSDAELARLGVTANEAASKMKALGIDVPPGLQKIVDATKQTGTSFEGLIGTVGKIAAAVGIGFSVGAIVNFGRAILNDADALVKLSDKTGISLQGLQKFQVAGDDAGNSIDQITLAVTQMQNRLVSGDASAVGALTKLGMRFEDIKTLAPDRQFMAIASAIRGVQDPAQQVALAMDVFGRSGAEVLPTIKRGFDDVKDSAVGMSDDTVKALDQVGDAWDRMVRKSKGAIAEIIVNVLTGARIAKEIENQINLANAYHFTMEELAELHTSVKRYVQSVEVSSLSTAEEAKIIKDLNRQLEAMQPALREAAKADEAVTSAMKAHWADVGAIVDRVFGVDALKKANDWLDAIQVLGGSITQLSNQDLADLQEAMLAGIDALARSGNLTSEQSSRFAEMAIAAQQAAAATKAVAAETHAMADVENQVIVVGAGMNASLERGAAIAEGAARSFAGLSVQIAATADQMSAFYADLGQRNSAGGHAQNNIGVPQLFPIVPGTGVQRRDSGGPVMAGQSYLIGRGAQPELFTPSSNGFMTPHGGGAAVYNTFNIVDTESGITRRVSDRIAQSISGLTTS